MHELSICRALVRELDALARREGAVRILRVVVRIGPLCGVEPQLLRQAYPLASAGTAAAGAELVLEQPPIRVHCAACGVESEATMNRLVCAACGDHRTQLLSGDEMLLAQVEIERDTAPVAHNTRH
ncbi:MAG: hydrogenase maturation nickel metallochaperone HypA [Gammaproteobacteria bacterium]